jgi:hypothetical protein
VRVFMRRDEGRFGDKEDRKREKGRDQAHLFRAFHFVECEPHCCLN